MIMMVIYRCGFRRHISSYEIKHRYLPHFMLYKLLVTTLIDDKITLLKDIQISIDISQLYAIKIKQRK